MIDYDVETKVFDAELFIVLFQSGDAVTVEENTHPHARNYTVGKLNFIDPEIDVKSTKTDLKNLLKIS